MAIRTRSGPRESNPARYRLLMVAMGIALFTAGFVLTLRSISEDNPTNVQGASQGTRMGSDDASQSGLWLIAGFVVSLAGLVLATVGPAVSYIKALRL